MNAPQFGLGYKQTPADLIRERMDDDAFHDCMGDFCPQFKVRSAMLQALLDGDDAELGRIVKEHCKEWAVDNLWEAPNTDRQDDYRQRIRDMRGVR